MESRTSFDARIHFFEYFSLEKFEESLRNALQYSIGIIFQQDRFIHLYQYSKEITLLIEFCINLPYAIKYSASYAEYFYGFLLSDQKTKKIPQRIITLLIRLLIPYALQKIEQQSNNYQGYKKQFLAYTYRSIKFVDIIIKLQYLLNDEQKSYSLFYYIIRQQLNRFKMESPYKYAMLLIYLGMKFLDFYFSKKTSKIIQGDQIVKAPKDVDPKTVQKYCPKCLRIPQIPSVLKTTGFVFCLACLQQMVINNEITNEHIIKLF